MQIKNKKKHKTNRELKNKQNKNTRRTEQHIYNQVVYYR